MFEKKIGINKKKYLASNRKLIGEYSRNLICLNLTKSKPIQTYSISNRHKILSVFRCFWIFSTVLVLELVSILYVLELFVFFHFRSYFIWCGKHGFKVKCLFDFVFDLAFYSRHVVICIYVTESKTNKTGHLFTC